ALVDKILSNQSAHYNTSMTFRQLARRYATSPTWVKNVTHNLGTTPGTTIAEYFDLPAVRHPSAHQESEGRFVAHVAARIQDFEIAPADAVDKLIFRQHGWRCSVGGHQTIC